MKKNDFTVLALCFVFSTLEPFSESAVAKESDVDDFPEFVQIRAFLAARDAGAAVDREEIGDLRKGNLAKVDAQGTARKVPSAPGEAQAGLHLCDGHDLLSTKLCWNMDDSFAGYSGQ